MLLTSWWYVKTKEATLNPGDFSEPSSISISRTVGSLKITLATATDNTSALPAFTPVKTPCQLDFTN
ncbi:hypothetical protein M8J75_005577 [Diaphorina citri]|nr:hypothetical protein M8J75_005577 [Diaphorina citri]